MIVSLLKYCFTQKIVSKTEMDYVLAALNLLIIMELNVFLLLGSFILEK